MCIFADMQSKYNFIWLKLMAFFLQFLHIKKTRNEILLRNIRKFWQGIKKQKRIKLSKWIVKYSDSSYRIFIIYTKTRKHVSDWSGCLILHKLCLRRNRNSYIQISRSFSVSVLSIECLFDSVCEIRELILLADICSGTFYFLQRPTKLYFTNILSYSYFLEWAHNLTWSIFEQGHTLGYDDLQHCDSKSIEGFLTVSFTQYFDLDITKSKITFLKNRP